MRHTARPQALLFVALFNSVLGLSILFPVLAPLGRQLGLGEVQIGWLSTAYSLMQFLGSPLWGKRSERVGRRPILLSGIFGFALAFASFGAVAAAGLRHLIPPMGLFIALLATRALGGFLSSATLPTAQAYIADLTERNERTAGMALVGAAFGLGIVFGPGIGALLAPFGLLVPVFASVSVAVLNGVFVAIWLPEPKRRAAVGGVTATGHLFVRAWPVLAVGFAVTLASVSMEQTVAFLFQDVLHLSGEHTARTVGTGLVLYGAAAVIAQGVVVRRVKLSPARLLLFGIPTSLLGFVLMSLASSPPLLDAALVLLGFGQGLSMPGISAALSLSARDDEQGEVAGLNSAALALGRTVGPVLGTGLYDYRHRAPFEFSAMLLGGLFVVVAATKLGLRRVDSA